MEINKVRIITRTAFIAALYVVLTYVFSWMSYEHLQFRISEILVLLVFIEPKYALGLVMGCALANFPSPLGLIDVFVGSLATLLAIVFIIRVRALFGLNKKGLIIASLGPVISNALLVGAELNYIFNTPFFLSAAYVAFGEFVVVSLFGTAVIDYIMKNKIIMEKLSL